MPGSAGLKARMRARRPRSQEPLAAGRAIPIRGLGLMAHSLAKPVGVQACVHRQFRGREKYYAKSIS